MIYFIQNTLDQAIKIGYSENPSKRHAALQSSSAAKLVLLGVIPGGLEHKGQLHRRFACFRLRGDWFRGEILPEVRPIIAAEAAHPQPVTVNMIVAGDSGNDFLWSTDTQLMAAKTRLEAAVYQELDALHAKTPIAWLLIAHGRRQIEAFAERWAVRNRVQVQWFRQNWRKYGRGAAAQAGRRMLNARFDAKLLLVFVGDNVSSTTRRMIQWAKKAGMEVVVKVRLAGSGTWR